jgi:hypothetical protein
MKLEVRQRLPIILVVAIVLSLLTSLLFIVSASASANRARELSMRLAIPSTSVPPLPARESFAEGKSDEATVKAGAPSLAVYILETLPFAESSTFAQPYYTFPEVPGRFYNRYRPRDPTRS